ncbi:protein kinase domain-containing protein [Colletotrichum sojae]|uniref:EKC/KEOPS complex subunit BUD32 n=1 Tax=Colletotrichum sojae TaxID=2175907 RepID=A0A8H6J8M6_9PEZI|nr:protein kinase domain-containing protein [Colletotrichum sojae]
MTLGERLSNGRYTVYHKLGHGGYSTVWLAYDEPEKRHVAIKVMAAVAEELQKHTRGEIEMLRCINNLPGNHPGKSLMLSLLDSFVHEGPLGNHDCYVSVPQGYSIEAAQHDSGRLDCYFSADVARAIAAQLIIAVSFLHENGIIHGDLTVGNFLLSPPDFDSLSPDQVCDKIGWPEECEISLENGKAPPPGYPRVLVIPARVGADCWDVELRDAKITAVDFGLSWKPEDQQRYSVFTPFLYRAPEAKFSEREQRPLDFHADVWALGMMIYRVYSRGSILDYCPGEAGVWKSTISMLGKPPQRWWDMWEDKSLYFHEDGEWISDGEKRTYPLEERVMDWLEKKREGGMPDEEKEDLLDLLRKVLRWEPEERASATELLKTDWMKKWGVPALEAMYLARGEDRDVRAEIALMTGTDKEGPARWPVILRNPFSTLTLGPGSWLKRFSGGFGVAIDVRWWMRLKDVLGKLF